MFQAGLEHSSEVNPSEVQHSFQAGLEHSSKVGLQHSSEVKHSSEVNPSKVQHPFQASLEHSSEVGLEHKSQDESKMEISPEAKVIPERGTCSIFSVTSKIGSEVFTDSVKLSSSTDENANFKVVDKRPDPEGAYTLLYSDISDVDKSDTALNQGKNATDTEAMMEK